MVSSGVQLLYFLQCKASAFERIRKCRAQDSAYLRLVSQWLSGLGNSTWNSLRNFLSSYQTLKGSLLEHLGGR